MANAISSKQLDYINRLLSEADTLSETANGVEGNAEVERLLPVVEAFAEKVGDLTTTEASFAIKSLQDLVNVLRKLQPAKPLSEDETNARAWINANAASNNFAQSLKNQLETKGFLSPRQLECALKGFNKDAAAAKKAEAPKDGRDSIQIARDNSKALAAHVPDRKYVGLAIPSLTGNNDLDFFVVSVYEQAGTKLSALYRVIGGRGKTRIYGQAAAKVTAALLALTSEEVAEAGIRFGLELGICGHCGRELTDEESRARGIGPVCATR